MTSPLPAPTAERQPIDHARSEVWIRRLRAASPLLVVAAAIAAGAFQGAAAVILVLAAGALAAVVAVLWASVRTLAGETPLSAEDALALGAPSAEEEQKRAVLRALKDLEFERSVGKISDEDYAELTARYREDAKRLLRQIEGQTRPARATVEPLVEARLRAEGLLPAATAAPQPTSASSTRLEAEGAAEGATRRKAKKKRRRAQGASVGAPETAHAAHVAPGPASSASSGRLACRSCGTANDPDATFCKRCGARQESPTTEVVQEPTADGAAAASVRESAPPSPASEPSGS